MNCVHEHSGKGDLSLRFVGPGNQLLATVQHAFYGRIVLVYAIVSGSRKISICSVDYIGREYGFNLYRKTCLTFFNCVA